MSPSEARHRAPRQRRRYRVLLASLAFVLAAAVGVPAALAAVNPAPETATNGNAGYDARNAAGFTDTQAVVNPDQYALTIAKGAQGAQLCNTTSGFGAQVGLASNNLTTVFAVGSVVGTIPTPGCPAGGEIPGAVIFPNLSAVPYGHHVWTDVSLVKKTKTIRVLICFPVEKATGHVVPTMTPSPTTSAAGTPTSTATSTASTTAKHYGAARRHSTPTPSATTTTATPTPTSTVSVTAPPTATPTGTPSPLPTAGKPRHDLKFICVFKTITIVKNVVAFQAQDLDAPTVPTPGDLAGVQTRYVAVPAATLFDSAGLGVNENLTNMVACAGPAADLNTYPRTLAGPAAYTTAACQPVSVFEFGTATPTGGVPADFQALTTQEGISPAGTTTAPALVAPNNTISTVNTGPHAPTGSAAGSHFQINTANTPTS